MLEELIRPGVSTIELEKAAEEFIKKHRAVPSFKGYNGYAYALCTSVNSQIVHAAPGTRKLKEGDIISIDVGVYYKGLHTDAARTFAVGEVNDESKKLIQVARECFFEAIKPLRHGVKLSLIGERVQNHAHKNGFSVVRDLAGHGVGKNLHENPVIMNYKNSSAFIVEEGMTLAIEPMINAGTFEVAFDKKSIEVKTKDGRRSAHYENTVLITKTGVEILTEAI